MIYKIETGIEPPEKTTGKPLKYPFDKMQPGDSFFVPCDSNQDTRKIRNAANSYGKRHDKSFLSRIVDGGMRVWRTA